MRIGRYQLLFRLGKGGMGEDWAAGNDHSDLGFRKVVARTSMGEPEQAVIVSGIRP